MAVVNHIMLVEKDEARIRKSTFLKMPADSWPVFLARAQKAIWLSKLDLQVQHREYVLDNYSIYCNGVVTLTSKEGCYSTIEMIGKSLGKFKYLYSNCQARGDPDKFLAAMGYTRRREVTLQLEVYSNSTLEVSIRREKSGDPCRVEVREDYCEGHRESSIGEELVELANGLAEVMAEEGKFLIPA